MHYSYHFQSNQLTKDNDSSFFEVFPVVGYSYKFRIKPLLPHWRLGMRFTMGNNQSDEGRYARYKDTSVRHLEICTGRFDNDRGWYSESHLEMVGYMPSPRENPLYVNDDHMPLSDVIMRIIWNAEDTVSFEVETSSGVSHSEPVNLGAHDYFKLFAWAENSPYSLQCEIEQSTLPLPISLGDYGPMKNTGLSLPIKDLAVVFGRNNAGKSSVLTAMCQKYLYANGRPADYIGLNRNYSITEYNFANEGLPEIVSLRKASRETRMDREPGMHQHFDWIHELSIAEEEVRNLTISWVKEYFEEWTLAPQQSGKHITGYKLTANGRGPLTQGNGAKSTIPIIMQLYNPELTFLAIDEPEFGLEARMQKIIFKAIKDASQGLNGFPKKRVVIATHSHLFLDKADPQSNFCVTKVEDDIDIYQLKTLQDLEQATYQLLGNTPADLFYPSNIIIVEGWTDQCFLIAVYKLMLEAERVTTSGISVHALGGVDNAEAGATALDQMLSTVNYTPVYRDRICVMVDSPDTEGRRKRIEEAFRKTGTQFPERLLVLDKGAIEYYYPLSAVNRAFGKKIDKAGYDAAIGKFLKSAKHGKDKRGKFLDVAIQKKDLASKITDAMNASDLNEIHPSITNLITIACGRGFQ
jgi:hypothetical protein